MIAEDFYTKQTRASNQQSLTFTPIESSKAKTTSYICSRSRGRRVRIITLLSLLWIGCVFYRLYQLQIAEYSSWQGTAVKQHVSAMKLASERGNILDRNGKILATSVPSGSIFVRPYLVKERESTIKVLHEHLDLPWYKIEELLDKKSPFVWIARQVPKPLAERVNQLAVPGIGVMLEARRYYPFGSSASTLLGAVGVDGIGLSGLEAVHDEFLHETPYKDSARRDGFGNVLHVSHKRAYMPKGKDLSLTLDARLQLILDEELEVGREKAKALKAMGVMIDAHTGEILALSQTPNPNFNSGKIESKEILTNHLLESAFEPGSIMKPIVAALALQHGETSSNEIIDCEKGKYRYGGHTINDVHPSSRITTHSVVVQSSNIGMTKLGDRLGRDRLRDGLSAFGFGNSTQLGLFGEASGILRKTKSWYPIDIATHSFGQGFSVTPLQVVRAISAIPNGGVLPRLSLYKGMNHINQEEERVLDSDIADQARQMMIGVVNDKEGTGSKAKILGVTVGGKTGTAQRPRDGAKGYEPGAYISSFVGFAEGESLGINRTITLLVVMDRPGVKPLTGGYVAAPVFQKVMHRALYYLSTETLSDTLSEAGNIL